MNEKREYLDLEVLDDKQKAFINFLLWRAGERGHAPRLEILFGAWLLFSYWLMELLGLVS
jgi:hypothetical protein